MARPKGSKNKKTEPVFTTVAEIDEKIATLEAEVESLNAEIKAKKASIKELKSTRAAVEKAELERKAEEAKEALFAAIKETGLSIEEAIEKIKK